MTDFETEVVSLARELVSLDSRSFVSNLAVAERVETSLAGFDIERIDYTDDAGVAKRALVAHRGPMGGIALSGHMDTVPDTGWQEDPWSARLGTDGILHGLGSTDMKGPVAAAIVAARALPERVPITLLITTDEETTKQGARLIAQTSELVRRVKPKGIIVAEPTALAPVRGHRSHIAFTCVGDRRAGAQQHRARAQCQLGADPVPDGDEVGVRAAAQRCQSAGRGLRSAVQRLQRGDRQPRRRDERDRAEGHRADQVPLLGQSRSRARAGSGVRCGEPLRHRGERGARRLPAGTAGRPPPGAAVRRSGRQAAPERRPMAPTPPSFRRSHHASCWDQAISRKRTRRPRRCAWPTSPRRCRCS